MFTNSPCIFLTIILQLADHALSELSGQPNVAIPSSSSQPSIPVGSNLEEIRLKQVSVLPLAGFNIPLFLSAILIPSPFQAQDSPDNSLFSFQIGATSQEKGEEATSADSVVLSDEIKAKLQQSLQFLNQDIGQLVKNAQPIRAILEELEGKLPESIEDVLTSAAFIESHHAQFHKAQKQLADRLQQEETIKQRDDFKALAESAVGEIKSLNATQASIMRNKAALETERDRLLKELNRVNQAIDIADHDLSQIPPAIAKLGEDKQKHARQAYQLHKSLWPILGSSADNNQVIENIDQIRLRAIKVIREALGLL